MKIVCDSCGAKYSIADEKVAGKVFKIRCKKCSSVIVVRGDEVQAPEEADATRVFDYGSDAIWHVVVAGDQQGPFPPAQLGAMLTQGQVDWEAYVWREGFDGWRPMREVPDLVQQITGGAQNEPAAAAAPAEQAEPALATGGLGADPFGGGEADLFAGAAAPATSQAHAPFDMGDDEATRAVAAPVDFGDSGGAADLFAQPAGGQADAFGAGAPADAGSPAGALGVVGAPGSADPGGFSGQRNENSVLFSLGNLQALATGGGPAAPSATANSGPTSAGPGSGVPASEGSGLIDIKALASTASLQSGPRASAAADDLLAIGTGAPAIGGGLGAPMLAPVEERSQDSSGGGGKGLVIGGSVAVMVVCGLAAAAFFAFAGGDTESTISPANDVPTSAQQETAETAPAAAGESDEAAPTAAADTEAEAGEAEAEAEAEPAEPAEPARELTPAERRAAAEQRERARTERAARAAAAPSRPAPVAAAAMTTAPPAATMRRSTGDLDSFLNSALSGMSGMAPAPAPAMAASNLPAQPSRSQVASSLRSVSSRVARCGGGEGGQVNVRVSVSGRTGRVTSANVSGAPNGGVRSCVSAAVRGARFPRFSNPTFGVTFPYRLN